MTVNDPDAQWSITVSTTDLVVPSWTLYSAPGLYGDAETQDDLPDLVLVDPFVVDWEFRDGQVPGQLEPTAITFNVWARSVDDLPSNLARGTLLEWELKLYPNNPFPPPVKNPDELPVYAVTGGRITEAILQLVPGSAWPARMTVKAVDLLAELPSLGSTPASATAPMRKPRERLVQISAAIGRAVGLPTGTTDGTTPANPIVAGNPRMMAAWKGNAREQLDAWCGWQDVMPAGIVTPFYDPSGLGSWPIGYGTSVPAGAWWQAPALSVPNTNVRYMISSGAKPNPNKLPLRLANVSGELVLQYAPEADQHTAALDGAFIEVPGQLRSGREHAPNVFRFTGAVEGIDATVTPNILVEREATADYVTADATATGPRAREIPTLLEMGAFDYAVQENPNNITADLASRAAPYLPDSYALSTSWALDAVRIHVHKMSQAQARSVIPKLIPCYPVGTGVGEGMDGVLIRHATLYNVPPEIRRLGEQLPQGYVAGGRITLERGLMTMELTLTPGGAQSTGTRITVGDVDAASWHAIPAGNIDPTIRVSDLALVDA